MSKTTTNYSEFLISTLGRLGDSLDDSLNIIKDVKFELENVLQHISGIIANQVNQILADLLEVIRAAVIARGYTIEDLEQVRAEKAAKRGGFEKRILLKEVYED